MEFLIALVLGVVGAALPLGAFLARQRSRRKEAEDRVRRAETELDRRQAVLATVYDGSYVWDCRTGEERCSPRLAELLGIGRRQVVSFAELLTRFDDGTARALGDAVQGLRNGGAPFRLSAVLAGGRDRFDAVGARAFAGDGAPFADILWLREAAADGEAASRSLAALLDQWAIPVWLRGPDLAIAYLNPAAAAVAGSGAARAAAERALAEGTVQAATAALDGGRRLKIAEVPIQAPKGTFGFAIEDREQAPPAMPVAEGVSAMVANLSTAVALFGRDGRLQVFNPAYAGLWRLDSTFLGAHPAFGDILDRLRASRRLPEVPDFRAFKADALKALGSLGAREERLLHLPDGTAVRRVAVPCGEAGVMFLDEDVTERLDLERRLRSMNAVQRATLDKLYEAVAVFGSDGRLKLVNPAFLRLWGLEADGVAPETHLSEVVGRMRPMPAGLGDWQAHKQSLVARLLSRQPGHGRLERADGSIVECANVPLPDGAVLLSYLDVTDSVRVEKALRERAEALNEANRLKSEFIANVSYELRTPLTTISGFAEVLSEEYFGKLNHRQLEYSRGILESARTLATVVTDILDLASIEAGTLRLALDAVDVHAALVGVLGLVRERARHKDVELAFDCPADIGWLVADERRFKQVSLTLLNASLGASPPRTVVTLAARREADAVVVAVADQGPAIPRAEQDRLFRPFASPPAGEDAPSPRVGLILVKRFVELHGGAVTLSSGPGKGTSVACAWPAARPSG